jgi:DNA polymerase III epsilon subunit-like protein
VKIPDEIEISSFVEDITGINKEVIQKKGKPIEQVLEKFYEAYMFCHGLVAHNMEFDEKMILVELERNRDTIMAVAPYCFHTFNPAFESVHGIQRYCTMKKGTDICNIMVESKMQNGKPRKKWPKLNELYQHLFPGQKVDGFHNSMIDVLACLRCFVKMKFDYDDTKIL